MKEKYTVTVVLHKKTVARLLPYYERFKELSDELSEQASFALLREWTFNQYIDYVLTSRCKDFMLSNAGSLEKALKSEIANQKGVDTNG